MLLMRDELLPFFIVFGRFTGLSMVTCSDVGDTAPTRSNELGSDAGAGPPTLFTEPMSDPENISVLERTEYMESSCVLVC